MIASNIWIVLAVAAVFCSVGFIRFVWFMSVGYGLSVAALGVTYFVLYSNAMNLPMKLMCAVMLVYGLRLGLFLLIRELKNANYRKTLSSAGGAKKVPFPVMFVMWLIMAVLYFMETCPLYFRAQNITMLKTLKGEETICWVGVAISAIAVVIEALADAQKNAAKKVNPHKPCMTGLYKVVRCPNYFGEILFWTGLFISGVTSFYSWQWAIALCGYIMIVYIMLSGAKRIELRQKKSYGSDKEFAAYAAKTPLLFPLIPLKSLEKVGFIK
ncbi:MAG: DUF1295 domain-containing protein [Sphaerochaetaceae bacterium]|nr:DUF1295 domain-containing protein [Sphaerochaetaceae bacterium]